MRLKELLCAEKSGVTAGQRLGQWQPTLGARVFLFFFFFEFVSPNVGQVKVSWGNKGFIKAPMFVWSAHVQENQTVFFLKLLQWQKCNWPFIF